MSERVSRISASAGKARSLPIAAFYLPVYLVGREIAQATRTRRGWRVNRESHRSAGIVLFRDGEQRSFLLLRSALTRRPVWEFPKGAIETGETHLEAAERELQEEAGLGPGDYEVITGFRAEERYFFTRGEGSARRLIQKQVSYFLAEWHRGEVKISREATRFEWATLQEAQRLLRFPEKRRVLASADRWLQKHRPRLPSADPRSEPPHST
jgi:8-oxo-dGTP pyrophosphatase MutT (NUDIX family)